MGRRGLLKEEGFLTPSSCEDRRRSCLMSPPLPPPSSFSSSTHASSSSSVSFLSSLAGRVLSMDLGRPLREGGGRGPSHYPRGKRRNGASPHANLALGIGSDGKKEGGLEATDERERRFPSALRYMDGGRRS